MKTSVFGLTCLATAALTPIAALDVDLQTGPNEARLAAELLNQHWSNNVVINDASTGHLSGRFRFYDIGLQLDGFLALDGQGDTDVGDFETTEFTARLDYLIEIEQYVQILPFVEVTSHPYDTGRPAYTWIGAEAWYLTPLEGLEAGASIQFNFGDSRGAGKANDPDNQILSTLGVRYFYQEAPLDTLVWLLTDIGNTSMHKAVSGVETRGFQTIKIGGRMTLPLPWEEMWFYGQAENIWYVNSKERDALELAGRDRSELVFALGVEWRAE